MPAKLLLIFISPFLLFSCTPASERAKKDAPLNVLFISIDDLRNDLGALGVDYVFTPHMDSFAEGARLFSRHYVQVPTCGSSRAALIRGQRAG